MKNFNTFKSRRPQTVNWVNYFFRQSLDIMMLCHFSNKTVYFVAKQQKVNLKNIKY